MTTETHGDRVKASILATGLALWRADPATVSARAIGQALGISHGAVLYHYGSADALKAAIAAEAVRVGDTVIVPMLIAARHTAADVLSAADRRRYLAGC
jgi:AcrR family transcriptional regulator